MEISAIKRPLKSEGIPPLIDDPEEGLEIMAIGKTELVRNKQSTARPNDLTDLARLSQPQSS